MRIEIISRDISNPNSDKISLGYFSFSPYSLDDFLNSIFMKHDALNLIFCPLAFLHSFEIYFLNGFNVHDKVA